MQPQIISLAEIQTAKDLLKQELRALLQAATDMPGFNLHITYLSAEMTEYTEIVLFPYTSPDMVRYFTIKIFAIHKLQSLPIDPRIQEQVTVIL